MIEGMVWMQTILIGVNTVVLLVISGTFIRWVMSIEKERRF